MSPTTPIIIGGNWPCWCPRPGGPVPGPTISVTLWRWANRRLFEDLLKGDGLKKGLFITFEGPEGSGKSTQIRRLSLLLKKRGIPHITTREPGGSKLSTHLRRWILNRLDYQLTPAAELHLFMADRAQHVREILLPALQKGKVVLCDRYTDSTLAYQGGGRGFSMDLLKKMNENVTSGLEPGLTLLFDLPVEMGLRRAAKRSRGKDRMERETVRFHQGVRRRYLAIARSESRRVRVIDGRPAVEAVFSELLRALSQRYRLFSSLTHGSSDE